MTKPTREIRTFSGIELKDAPKDSGFLGVIEGYAIRYDVDSHEFRTRNNTKPVVERIAKGAFTRSLAENKDITAVVEHDPSKPFARVGVNLEITEDDTGVFYRARIPDTSIGRDLHTNIKLGIIKANSFEFELRRRDGKATGVEWEQGDKQDRRIIRDAELFHVSPVIEPAYLGTTLALRSRRGYVAEADDLCCMDPTLTADAAFAMEMLAHEIDEMESAQEYLRASPTGPLADFAKGEITEAVEDAKMLLDWLAANGAIAAEPPTMKRARERIAQHSAPATQPNAERERRLRLLNLAPFVQ